MSSQTFVHSPAQRASTSSGYFDSPDFQSTDVRQDEGSPNGECGGGVIGDRDDIHYSSPPLSPYRSPYSPPLTASAPPERSYPTFLSPIIEETPTLGERNHIRPCFQYRAASIAGYSTEYDYVLAADYYCYSCHCPYRTEEPMYTGSPQLPRGPAPTPESKTPPNAPRLPAEPFPAVESDDDDLIHGYWDSYYGLPYEIAFRSDYFPPPRKFDPNATIDDFCKALLEKTRAKEASNEGTSSGTTSSLM